MKTFNNYFSFIFTFVFVFSSCTIFAQSGWFQQNPGTSKSFRHVFFVNQNTGYIAGDTVMKTTNGGEKWIFLTGYGSSIHFINPDTGFIGLSNGSEHGVGKTTNGGLNWVITTLNPGTAFSISFIDPMTGWAAFGIQGGGHIYKTTDGGLSWNNYYNADGQIYVKFLNSNTGYAEGYITGLRKSTDGGLNWSIVPHGNWGATVFAVDTNIVYGGGGSSGKIYRTTNSGLHWDTLQTGTNFPSYSFYFTDINTGYAVGYNQVILRTSNGGTNWQIQTGVNSNTLNSVHFINSITGWAVGDNGTILKTTDGGGLVSLQPQNEQIPANFKLYQNYPNPFNPVTKIKFDIPETGSQYSEQVRLSVYDIAGRETALLIDERLKTGKYETSWDASSYSSGVYFVIFRAGSFFESSKLILIK